MADEQPKSRQTLAFIFGASSYPLAPGLRQGSIFLNSALGIQEYVTSPNGLGLSFENVCWLFNDAQSPSDQMQALRNFLELRTINLKKSGTPALDLIIYYVGHGFFSGPRHDYVLAVSVTDAKLKGPTSLRVGDLAAVIQSFAPFVRRFLIFDCCFSAAAFTEFQSDPMEVGEEKLREQLPGKGTAILCSSSKDDPSLAPQGHHRTLFTASLLEALYMGHPSMPSKLSLGEVGELVKVIVRETGEDLGPRPEVHSPHQTEGDVATVPLFPNPSWSSGWQRTKITDSKKVSGRVKKTRIGTAALADDSKSKPLHLTKLREFLSQAKLHVGTDALRGSIIRPFQQSIPAQVCAQLQPHGGYLAQRSGEFRVEGLLSYKAASSEVFGESVDSKKYFRACSTIENLTILEVITADKLVSTISIDLSRQSELVPTVELLGTRIENLRIGGYPVDATLDAHFFELIPTESGFSLGRDGKVLQPRSVPYLQVRASYSQSFQQISTNTIELRGGGRLILGELTLKNGSLASSLLHYEDDQITISAANPFWTVPDSY